jgi:hypothetical protein
MPTTSNDGTQPSTKRKNKPRKPKIDVTTPASLVAELVKGSSATTTESVVESGSVSIPAEPITRIGAHTPTREEMLAGKPKDHTKPRKIAIVGSAPSSNRLAPFDDPAFEIWACSPANMKLLPRVDRWFENHKTQLFPEHIGWGGPYVEWLRSQSFILYMQDKDICANATPYPIADMLRRFSGYFFTSSFAYMFALAIAEHEDGNKIEALACYGADMATTKEYIEQMPAAHHFMWMASKMGIKVSCPPESDLMNPPPLYGYFEASPKGRKLYVRKQEIEGRVAHARQEMQQHSDTIKHLTGCLDAEDYHWRRHHDSSK